LERFTSKRSKPSQETAQPPGQAVTLMLGVRRAGVTVGLQNPEQRLIRMARKQIVIPIATV